MDTNIHQNLTPDPFLPIEERFAHPLFVSGGRIQPDRLYTAAEVRVILGVSAATLRRWRAQGTGPQTTRLVPGGPPRYRGEHILLALEEAIET